MATAQQIEAWSVWQDARLLVKEICQASKRRAFHGDFSLRDQIRRAATSTMSNVAEGFERGTRKEFIQFLRIAKGSIGEVRFQLYVALDKEHLDEKTFNSLKESTLALSRRLARFATCLEGCPGNSRRRNPPADLLLENLKPGTFNLQRLTQ